MNEILKEILQRKENVPPTKRKKKTTETKKSKEKGIHVGTCKQILIAPNNNDLWKLKYT